MFQGDTMQVEAIPQIWPSLKVEQISTQYGPAVRLTGKGAKVVANTLARENYLNGHCDTDWRDVRHGIGYLIPLYNNPMNSII